MLFLARLLTSAPVSRAYASTDVPVTPDADQARRWAEEELAKQAYQQAKPGFVETLIQWLRRMVADLFSGIKSPQTGVSLMLFLAVVVAVILVIIFIIRPRLLRRRNAAEQVFEAQAPLTAAEHRDLASAAASRGDFYSAVNEQFRALAKAGEERGACSATPGRTAFELALELSTAFPSSEPEIQSAAAHFSAVRYGHEEATSPMYSQMVATDNSIQAATAVYQDRYVKAAL